LQLNNAEESQAQESAVHPPQIKRRKLYLLFALLFLIVAVVVLALALQPSAPRYQSVSASNCGRWAVVEQRGRWGVIDVASGEEVIPIEYGRVNLSSGLAFVLDESDPFFDGYRDMAIIDIESGRELFTHPVARSVFFQAENGRAIGVSPGWGGLIDLENGEILIPLGQFSSIQIYGDLAVVYDGTDPRSLIIGGTWEFVQRNVGIIDLESGEILVPRGRFMNIQDVRDGMAYVECRETGQSIIDIESGEELISMSQFPDAGGSTWFSFLGNGRIATHIQMELGGPSTVAVIDIESGEEVIPFGRFDRISSTGIDDLVLVLEDGHWGIIHVESGNELLSIEYEYIQIYSGLALAWSENRELTIIDLENRDETPPSGMILIERWGRHIVIDLDREIEVMLHDRFPFVWELRDGIASALAWDDHHVVINLESGDELIVGRAGQHRIPILFADGVVAVQQSRRWGDNFWTFERVEDLIER